MGAWPSKTPSFLETLPPFVPPGAHSFFSSLNFPNRAGCVHVGRRVGAWGVYLGAQPRFPTRKQPNPSPEQLETLNRNRRQDAPAGKRPQPGFPSRVGPQ